MSNMNRLMNNKKIKEKNKVLPPPAIAMMKNNRMNKYLCKCFVCLKKYAITAETPIVQKVSIPPILYTYSDPIRTPLSSNVNPPLINGISKL